MRMSKANLTCILCPLSCGLELEVEAGEVKKVQGNSCNQGVEYADKEYTCPSRMLTATAELVGGRVNRIAVRTGSEIPKTSIPKCMKIIQELQVKAPVKRGQVLISNIAGTGVDLIASRSIEY